jgi:outer membrane protein assembly factor BamB
MRLLALAIGALGVVGALGATREALAGQAAQMGVATQLPPAPIKLWNVAWQRQLVASRALEWRPEELGGPAVDPVGGLVVVGTRDGWLHAYDPDGRRLWSFEAAGRFDAAPRVHGDLVYAGASDGRLLAIELASGRLRWKYEAQEEVGTTPIVSGGLVLVMTLQDSLIAVDAKTGAWKWHHRRETREGFTVRGAAPPLVSGGLALGAYSDGTVAALDLLTGTLKWERKVAPAGNFMDVDGLQVQAGRLFAAAYSGAVYAIDLQTGRQEWELKTPGASRLALGAGLLVAVTTTQVLGIGTQDGSVRWTLPLEGAPAGDPVLLGGTAAVPNGKDLLFIEASSGRLLRAFNPGTGVSASPAWRGRRVYVLSNSGDLLALDFT